MRVGPGGLVLQPASGAFDVTVAPGENVQAAVDRCPAGGCLLLLPGTHKGPLVLGPRVEENEEEHEQGFIQVVPDKVVHVFGRGRATLQAAEGTVLASTAASATVDGLILRREAGGGRNYCVKINGGRLRLQACDITNAELYVHCVGISDGADPIVTSSR